VLVCTKAVPEVVDTGEVVRPVVEWHDRESDESGEDVAVGEGGTETRARPRQPTYVLMQNGLGVEKGLVKLLEERRKVKGDVLAGGDGDAKEDRDVSVVGAALWIGTNIVNDEVVHGDFVSRIFLSFLVTSLVWKVDG
jgi:hypothetical protein